MKDQGQNDPAASEANDTAEPDDLTMETIADLDVVEEDLKDIKGGMTLNSQNCQYPSNQLYGCAGPGAGGGVTTM